MSRRDQYTFLEQEGVEAWNRWREDNPEIKIDLSSALFAMTDLDGINLSRADLSYSTFASVSFAEADFRNADLRYANFGGPDRIHADILMTNLSGADLGGADLSYADLSEAFFDGAILRAANLCNTNLLRAIFRGVDLYDGQLVGAQLISTNLNGANLGHVDLQNAVFSHCDLAGVNLSGAITGETVFADVDLRLPLGLDSIEHRGPSSIGIDSIYRSRGQIDRTFLKKCGLPESFLEYMESLANSIMPIEFHSVFISYSTENKDFATQLYGDLQKAGVRCWFAPEHLKGGDRFHQRIEESIHLYDKLLVILTSASISSPWVETEVVAAREREEEMVRQGRRDTVLYPIMLDDTVMETSEPWAADIRRKRHIRDFRAWRHQAQYRDAFNHLLRDLIQEAQV